MKFKARGSMLAASALAIALAPALLALGPANAAPASSNNEANAAATSPALEIYKTLDSAADPQSTFEALSASDKATFENYFLAVTSTETVSLTPLDTMSSAAQLSGSVASTYSSIQEARQAVAGVTGCWGSWTKATMHNAFGVALWDTFNEGTWCYNGTSVTSASFSSSWSNIAAVGWRDDGQIGSGSGVVSNQGRIWSQRRMILGVGGWDIQTMTPCNRLNGTASGGTSFTESCSTY